LCFKTTLPKFWEDLADEEYDHSLEKNLTFHAMENSSICRVKNVHPSNLMDRNDEVLIVLKDTNIAPIYNDATLRSVCNFKKRTGG